MYNNGACIGALILLLGLRSAYLHFHVTYSLIIYICDRVCENWAYLHKLHMFRKPYVT